MKKNRSDAARPRRPWQQNFLKVPQNILDDLSRIESDEIIVACLRRIPISTIQSGVYEHIGIVWTDDSVVHPDQIMPRPENGRASAQNAHGKLRKLKDEPMVKKTYSVTTPNYGDWSNGSHEMYWDRDVYQTEYTAPRELSIKIERVGEDVAAQAIVFRFTIDEVLDRTATGFEARLLYNLNLLQENVGNRGVYPSTAAIEEYLKTLYVNWEILPPGEREDNIARIFRTVGTADPRARVRIIDRYDHLARLRPINFIRGTNGFRNYFGAQFAGNLVVFENVEYGNAIYVMNEDWDILSKKSRTELMANHPDDVARIAHTVGWKDKLTETIRKERKKRSTTN